MQYPAPEGAKPQKKDETPGEEIEGFMLIDKEDNNVLKSVGFTTTGNPRFIFFSEKEANRFLLGEAKVKQRFELAKVIVRIVK